MRVPFVKLSPSGNMTILLKGQFNVSERAAIAVEIIDAAHLGAEQAGSVVYAPVPRLDMMGGEFCVNATRAFAALLAFEGKLEGKDDALHGEVESSGVDSPVAVRVRVHDDALAHAAIRLRLPETPEIEELLPGAWLVHLPGIAHLLLDAQRYPLPPFTELIAESAGWRQRFALETQPAVGVIRFWQNGNRIRIVPVVWVALTNSACVETACGSGSLAAALVGRREAHLAGEGLWLAEQAGGTLDVEMANDDEGFCAWIGGNVCRIAEGDVFVSEKSGPS